MVRYTVFKRKSAFQHQNPLSGRTLRGFYLVAVLSSIIASYLAYTANKRISVL